MKKKSLSLIMFACIGMFMLADRVFAQVSIDMPTLVGFSSQDIKTTIMNIIQIIIGFLGVVVVAGILFGGFKMMISRGDSDEMGKGRQIVVAGVIGLVIILAAYSIALFVVNSIGEAL